MLGFLHGEGLNLTQIPPEKEQAMGDASERDAGARGGSDHSEVRARREFLKKIGWAGATVPAVSLLLAAKFEHASAEENTGSGGSGSS
jgi:hypothetical protein